MDTSAGVSRPWGPRTPVVTVTLVALVALVAECGSTTRPGAVSTSTSPTTATSTTATSTTTSVPTAPLTYALYFLRGSYLGVAHRGGGSPGDPATTALSALVRGPDRAEGGAGLTTAIPPQTKLLGLRIVAGTATADLNEAFAVPTTPGDELARVAQVVYTLTQFPSVTHVQFEIGGSTPTSFASGAVALRQPKTRADVLGALPAILVETPAVGDALHGSLRLSGLANVFEAQFNVQLIDGSGKVMLDEPVHATAGSGTWGSFDVTYPYSASATTMSTLRVYDVSMKDGAPIDEVDLHLPAGP